MNLSLTCESCPSQWEGQLNDGTYIYVRYRFGKFTYGIGDSLDQAVREAMEKTPIILGEELDGFMEEATMRALLTHCGVIE